MKDFKVTSEAEDSYHIEHKDGRKFTVNKKELSPKAHEAIKKLCMGGMAAGGKVQKLNGADGESTVEESDEGPADNASDQAAPPAVENTPNAQVSPTDNLQNYGSNYGQVLDQKIQAVQNYAKQQQAGNQATNKVYSDIENKLTPAQPQVPVKSPDQIQADMAANDAQFMQQLQQKGKDFDPNRYWNDMGTGHKILAGIAMALGGAGSALGGGPNIAAEHLKMAINNDIEKQRADYSNTANVWKMNHQAYQDQLSTSLASKNQLLSVAQMQLAQQAANATNSKARLDTQMTLSDLQNQKNLNTRAMGLLSKRTAGPDGTLPTDPSIIASQLIQDPAQKKAAIGEIEQNQSIEQGRQFALDNFNKLADKTLGGAHTPERKSIVAATALDMAKRFGIRPNAAEDMAEEMLPGSGMTGLELESTVDAKRQRMNQLFDMQKNKMSVLRSNTGLGPEDFPSTSSNPLTKMSPKELKDYNLSKSAPNHPESIRFMNRMSKKYGSGF